MVDKNDSLPGLTPVYREIQIRSKKNLSKDSHDRNKDKQKHKKDKEQENSTYQTTFYEENDDIELGNLLIKRKNLEIDLYNKIIQKTNSLEPQKIKLENEINSLRYKILYIDNKLENYRSNFVHPTSEETIGLKFLNELLVYYNRYNKLANEENELIASENYDGLPLVMAHKNEALTIIESTIKNINFSNIKKLDSVDEKRVKAESIISDIKKVINMIIEKEEQNSVELQSQKKDLQYELSKSNSNLKAIKGYSRNIKRPHFIDTSK